MVPINSIHVPAEYCELCQNWYDGMGDTLYAVASTGNLTTGCLRPIIDGDPVSDERWYYDLWAGLSVDIGSARRAACKLRDRGDDNEDWASEADSLEEFEKWVDDICELLADDYGI